VALPGTPGGFLRAPTTRVEPAADMTRMIEEATCQADDGGDPRTGPERSAEAISSGTAMQQLGQTGEVLRSQPPRGSWGRPAPERFGAGVASPFHPLTNGSLADPNGLGHLALGPALLREGPGLHAPRFLPVLRGRIHAWQSTTAPPEF
jgi:hypothetical protein